MKIFQGLFLFSMFICQNIYALTSLSEPSGPSQCGEAYENAGEIKTINNVFSTLSSACHDAGGMRLTHQILLSENNNQPTGVLFTCTGTDPDFVVLSCVFTASSAGLYN
ncbi:hypothetical protein OQJ18_03205 [Fluoribacter dumoffii]|uniref:Uncharacterized protein n=1 Tax=Fluoribacter dumoffii TaxID=463 RepID=A0A377GA12_9GAMM|nr:hypothetical protein [Fluoribacter dumoffii]KTC88930.1 hypothetical protein Ldum_3188 [Fluoribacter dumoffii NY 23]MCW8385858.1 hypothetical protein [Fluoribacter dumoffii]MCW8418911.1 hypothetical protein [Fluoribacter dumoffii]MCW8453245.1 hypothetical protein [Fluoribacter dumoffii]MCW8459534.1 hypothetical protein [Fluoribacter dumoffii]